MKAESSGAAWAPLAITAQAGHFGACACVHERAPGLLLSLTKVNASAAAPLASRPPCSSIISSVADLDPVVV